MCIKNPLTQQQNIRLKMNRATGRSGVQSQGAQAACAHAQPESGGVAPGQRRLPARRCRTVCVLRRPQRRDGAARDPYTGDGLQNSTYRRWEVGVKGGTASLSNHECHMYLRLQQQQVPVLDFQAELGPAFLAETPRDG